MNFYKISIIITFLLLFTKNTGFSQSNDSAQKVRYEIGLSLPVVEAINGFKLFYHYQYASFKIEKNRNALRTSFGTLFPMHTAHIKRYNHIASIGYERRIFKRKSQLLLGADLNYNYNYSYYHRSHYFLEKKTMYSIGPVIAYLYKPTEHLAFQLQFPVSIGPAKFTYNNGDIKRGISTLFKADILTAYYRF